MKTPIDHRVPRTWEKITITVPQSNSDELAAFLGTLCESGVQTITPPEEGLCEGQERLIGYLLHDKHRTQKIERLHAFLSIHANHPRQQFPLAVKLETIQEEDWNAGWKKHFKPAKLTDRLVVRPSWEIYTPKNDELVMVLDPGMAFGTGLHGSTQLVLRAIEKLYTAAPPPKIVLDVGTGTGILGMFCALLGSEDIIGIDNDIDASTAAKENVRINGLAGQMTISTQAIGQLHRQFDLVLANITHKTILALADDLLACLGQSGTLILSGILSGEQEESIISHFQSHNLKVTTKSYQDEWVSLSLKRKNQLMQRHQ